MEINKIFLEKMYWKAKQAFNSCIQNKENAFLQEEIEFPIHEIILKEEFVKIQFSENESDKYVIETKHILVSPTRDSFGYYSYYENESGEVLDDFLVFD